MRSYIQNNNTFFLNYSQSTVYYCLKKKISILTWQKIPTVAGNMHILYYCSPRSRNQGSHQLRIFGIISQFLLSGFSQNGSYYGQVWVWFVRKMLRELWGVHQDRATSYHPWLFLQVWYHGWTLPGSRAAGVCWWICRCIWRDSGYR